MMSQSDFRNFIAQEYYSSREKKEGTAVTACPEPDEGEGCCGRRRGIGGGDFFFASFFCAVDKRKKKKLIGKHLHHKRLPLRKPQLHKHPHPLKPVFPADLLPFFHGARMVGNRLLMDRIPAPRKHAGKFGIEAEIVFLKRESLQNVPPHHLVARRLVGEIGSKQEVADGGEHGPPDEESEVHKLLLLLQAPGTEERFDIVLLGIREEPRNLLWRVLKVGILHDDIAAVGMLVPHADRRTLSPILFRENRILRTGEGADNLERPVFRSVIHENHFCDISACGKNTTDDFPESSLLVVDGHHNTQTHIVSGMCVGIGHVSAQPTGIM